MKSKFIIFVVFACVSQNSFVLSVKKSTSETLAGLAKIQKYQEIERIQTKEGVGELFDEIIRSAGQYMFCTEIDIDYNVTTNQTIQKLQHAFEATYDAVNIVAEQPESVVQSYRSVSNAYLDMAVAGFNAALRLANSGKYSRYPDHVDNLEISLALGTGYPMAAVSAFLRTSLSPTGEVEAVIKSAEDKSVKIHNKTAAALMNGLKLYDQAVSRGTHKEGVALLDAIEHQKSLALSALEDRGHIIFSAISALFTHLQLSSGGSVSKLHARRYALARATIKAQDAFEAIYNVLNNKLNSHGIRLRDAGKIDFSPTEEAQATYFIKLLEASDIYVNTVQEFTETNNRGGFQIIRHQLINDTLEFSVNIFKAISLVDNVSRNYSDILDEINSLEKELQYQETVRQIFDVIRNSNSNFQSAFLSRIIDFESKALAHFTDAYRYVFEAIRAVAQVYHGIIAESGSDYESKTIESVQAVVRSIFAAVEIGFLQATG